MISRDQLQEMFDVTRAKAKWSIDGICLWGNFFTDHCRERLLAAVPALEKMGYRLVGLLDKPTPRDDDQGLLFLLVERAEQHTVDSLDARNRELYRFAEEFALESYDGMEVGPIKNRGV
jgi:hypothetical protein